MAANSPKHTPLAHPREPSSRSLEAYEYLLQFKGGNPVDLLTTIPALGNIVGGSGPKLLTEPFSNMSEPMKDAFSEVSRLPAGVHFVHGVQALEKSYMMEMIILFSQFGACAAETEPSKAKADPLKVLYHNNVAVEVFTSRLIDTYSNMGCSEGCCRSTTGREREAI